MSPSNLSFDAGLANLKQLEQSLAAELPCDHYEANGEEDCLTHQSPIPCQHCAFVVSITEAAGAGSTFGTLKARRSS